MKRYALSKTFLICGILLASGPSPASDLDDLRKMLAVQAAAIKKMQIPPGTVITFAGNAIPDGWLVCDGTEYSIASYPNLAAALGTTWNQAVSPQTRRTLTTGAGNFRVPDFRNVYLRGVGSHNSVGVTTSLGEFQAGMIGPHDHSINHSHAVSDPGHSHDSGIARPVPGTSGWVHAATAGHQLSGEGIFVSTVKAGVSVAAFQGSSGANAGIENRPDSVGIRYLIKY